MARNYMHDYSDNRNNTLSRNAEARAYSRLKRKYVVCKSKGLIFQELKDITPSESSNMIQSSSRNMIIDKSNLFLSLKSVTNESSSNFEDISLNGGDSNSRTPVNELEK